VASRAAKLDPTDRQAVPVVDNGTPCVRGGSGDKGNVELEVVVIRTMGSLRILAGVGTNTVTSLVDSGAAVSCVEESLTRHLPHTEVKGLTLRTANNSLLQIVGQVEADINIGGNIYVTPLIAVKGLSAACILGNDFCSRHKAVISYVNNCVTFTHDKGLFSVPFENVERCHLPNDMEGIVSSVHNVLDYDNVVSVVAAHDVEVRGESIQRCGVNLVGEVDFKLGLFEPEIGLLENKGLVLRDALMHSTFNKLDIANVTDMTRRIAKGTKFGHYTQVAAVYDANSDEKDLAGNGRTTGGQDTGIGCRGEQIARLDINPELAVHEHDGLAGLLETFHDVFAWSAKDIGKARVDACELRVKEDQVVHVPPFRVAPKEREIIREQVDEMLRNNVIRPSRSHFASPVVLVRKKNGSWRFCVDFRKVNDVLCGDTYPLPLIADILASLNGSKYFSLMDLFSGFWQLPLAENSKYLTSFITGDGLWEFNVLPFGLKVSPALFQRGMDRVLAGLKWSACLVYLDDILCMAPDFETHQSRLGQVLLRFRESGLKLNPDKCTFGYQKIKILGYIVDEVGISPDPKKLQAITDFSRPTKLKDLRSFIGLANFYRMFIRNFSMIAKPLTDLTRKSTPFVWKTEQEEAFQELKLKLSTAPVLHHFSEEDSIELHTDACGYGIAGILMQRVGGELHPVSYASRKLTDAETRYNVSQQECLAIVWSIRIFRPFLYGREFKVIVDHCALCWLRSNSDVTGRLARWAILLQDYQFQICHKSGKLHMAPDCLSRYPIDGIKVNDEDIVDDSRIMALHLTDISRLQSEDQSLRELIDAMKDPDNATASIRRKTRSYVLAQDILYKKQFSHGNDSRVLVVPESLKYEILYSLHDDPFGGGHLGYARTYGKIRDRYFWEGMAKEIEAYCQSCPDCQSRKRPTQRPAGLLCPIPVGKPFSRLGIDLLGPMRKTPAGNTFIVCCTDYATKWAITKSLPSGGASDVAQFIVEDVICQHSCPKEILSDRGQVFRSNLVMEILRGLGTRPTFTTSYHPSCNGLTEKFNGVMAQMLSNYCNSTHTDWDKFVPAVTFAYNCSKQETTGFTPFYLLHGFEPEMPIDISLRQGICTEEKAEVVLQRLHEARQLVLDRIKVTQAKQKRRFDASRRHVEYKADQLIKLYSPIRQKGKSDKLQHRWLGPYRVVRKISDLNYEIAIKKGLRRGDKIVTDVVHVVRMKPFYPPDKWRTRDKQTSDTTD
jgi:RNase H-like domain found in reverse transcriptase/Reverse transcriptase (RNA-dependent DNA polymerase)/Integrase zinc binding domain